MNKEQARDLTQSIIQRAQTMRSFKVKLRVDDGWLPQGPVPYNIHIKDGVATLTVVADSMESARNQAAEYMKSDDWCD
jgi:hypothetical protein